MNTSASESIKRPAWPAVARAWEFARHPRLWSGRQRALAWVLLAFIAILVSFAVSSQTTLPPNIQVDLTKDPLYSPAAVDKPALTLALSVQFPIVGALNINNLKSDEDDTYNTATEYLGYYDANSCYAYNDMRSETPASTQNKVDYIRFDRVGLAGLTAASATTSNHRCDLTFPNAFSGNFLNWVSSSGIDILRLALSGGDRYIDTPGSFSPTGAVNIPAVTILQRAVIPNGNPMCMWNSDRFQAKQLQKDGGNAGAYWGAVPRAMITAANGKDIWVANTLNKIYFGTSKTGTCGDTSGYQLNASTATEMGPAVTPAPSPGTDPVSLGFALCGNETTTCTFSGVKEVLYGAGNQTGWIDFYASNLKSCASIILPDTGLTPQSSGKCYIRDTDAWAPAHSNVSSTLNTTGFFYSRVQVCNQDQATGMLLDIRDYDFCTKYSNGNYKPGGAIQKYSDQLRLSAFGYLLDQTYGAYGGVLRAPMKYVGANTFDSSGQQNTPTSGNPVAEWDLGTGVFKTNPDNDAMGISGVVNYLNKFGRTGIPGIYKAWDPLGELYYESLRYLQGLQPTPAAISNVTPATKDGFPVFKTWADPYGDDRVATGKYSCVKSNIVVIGDVFNYDSDQFPKVDLAHNIPDRAIWTDVVGNFEKGSNSPYVDGQGVTRQTGNPNPPNPWPLGSDALGGLHGSTALIGYAYWAHTHDIRGSNWTDKPALQRPGLRVKTFTFDVNEFGSDAAARHYKNSFFTAAKYGGFEADPAVAGGKPYNTFGNPFKQQDGTNNNNVWQDPASPGDASAYFMQSNGRSVLSAFDSIFKSAATASRSIAGGAIPSTALTQQGSTIYQAAFDTSDWTGDLLAIPIDVSGTNDVSISKTNLWSASDQLKALPSPATSRNIVIGSAGAGSNPTAMPFTWAGIATNVALMASLNQTAPGAPPDTQGESRLNYLRGSSADEGTKFRRRNNKLLGDIINSGVAYSGVPTTGVTSASFAAFQQDNRSRTSAVFVGANDGMLHAFNAANGNELFGYIPSWLGPKLSALTVPSYVNNHQSYVDASPVVADAETGTTGTKADWKTVLVSGTGAGGRGVFALDITDPTAFSAAKVLWEFTQADDADMGNVVGRPRILKFRTSAANVAPATYKWFAAVGSGVNNGSGTPALFLLDLAKPVEAAWTQSTKDTQGNYFKISLPVNSVLAATKATGLLNFSAVAGPNNEVTQLFAGDLHGSMWKLDFRPYGVGDWDMSALSAFTRGTAGGPYPLYIAKDASGNVQPISAAPALVRNPVNANLYVAFGTGKFLETADRSATSKQSFYVVLDNQSTVPDSSLPVSAISGRGRLIAGTVNTTTGVIDVPSFAWGRPLTDTDATQRAGFYADLTAVGERQISGMTLVGDTLIFGSLIPGSAGDAAACSVSGGGGFEYRVNVDTGDGKLRASTVGMLGQPFIIDLTSATTSAVSDSTGRRIKTTQSIVFAQGSTGTATSQTQTTTVVAGRLSWRQINNYQDLKNTP